MTTVDVPPPPSDVPPPRRPLSAAQRFGLLLAYLWWKAFAALLFGNYVPGGALALIQGGWPALWTYVTSWGLLRPVEALNPPVFWAAAAVLALLAVLGFFVERQQKAAERAAARAEARREGRAGASEVVSDFEQRLLAAGAISVRELPEPPFDLTALPAPPIFVGRDANLEWLLARLRQGGTTGITALGGLGGIGKTALAAVAARVLYKEGRFKDGIVAVSCLGLSDPVAVLAAVLTALGGKPPDGATDQPALAHALYQRLRGHDVLIVLDNVEPELRPLTAVTIPLREAGATLLITARQMLSAEVVAADDTLKLDVLPEADALLLFATTYAGANKTPDDLSASDRAAAEHIITTLARHTLAVKLAAAYAREAGRDLPGLARELAADPLKVPGEDASRAVELAFRQSTDRLPDEARRLFAALAVFATNEFGRRAALAVAAGLALPDPETALDLLVRRALLDPQTAAELPDDADRERLRQHPLLRELAAEQLDAATRATAALALARFYAEYASTTPDPALAPDAENITGALEWAHEHAPEAERDELVAAICDGMRQFWRDRSRTRDSLRYLPWGISASEGVLHISDTTDNRLRAARLTRSLGELLRSTGRLNEAESIFRANLEIRRGLGDRKGEGIVLSDLGQIARRRGRLEEAEGYFQQSLAIRREVQDRQGEGVALSNLGQIARRRGRLEEAEGYFQQSLAIDREVQDRQGEGVDLSNLGQIARRRGRLEEAEGYFQQSLAIRREVQDRQGEGVVLYSLALIAEARGDLDRAEALHRESLQISFDVQNARDAADSLQTLGQFLIEHHRGSPDEGCDMLQQAIRIYHEMGVPDEQDARALAQRLGCSVGE
jgi:tetratricopeptide (TPR) repeat protein